MIQEYVCESMKCVLTDQEKKRRKRDEVDHFAGGPADARPVYRIQVGKEEKGRRRKKKSRVKSVEREVKRC